MPAGLWACLDCTNRDIRPDILDRGFLDPAYSPLEGLLMDFGHTLRNDIFWATKEPFTHPEFIHEAMQRFLLDFVFENLNEHFMDLAIASSSQKTVTAIAGGISHSMPRA
ncbi:hypothetical protein BDN70DRAFT_540112 [Pholiota conissans]|uniref:Uncharacterized protein n=1 Tax=Pholiota conissans TaxID=109636 RepID=A0A9P5ZG05_9AGAR|nr:hypothetical protein BDN70DRAFT_540112 [Pholiota conissans]